MAARRPSFNEHSSPTVQHCVAHELEMRDRGEQSRDAMHGSKDQASRAATGTHKLIQVKCTCIVKNAYVVRISRTWWMRLLPFSKNYHCTHCEARFMRFSDLRHDYGARVARDSPSQVEDSRTRERRRVRAGTAPR
jgi:hypothetical protein